MSSLHDPREELLTVHLEDTVSPEQIDALEQELSDALEPGNVGRSASNEQEGKEIVLYFHGPDAQKMRDAVQPILSRSSIRPIVLQIGTGSFLAGTREQKSERIQ
jgi:hypothetical protein